jgi:hypothetical protein
VGAGVGERRPWRPSTTSTAPWPAGRPEVLPEELAQVAPRSLEEADQRRFLRIVDGASSAAEVSCIAMEVFGGESLSDRSRAVLADLDDALHQS